MANTLIIYEKERTAEKACQIVEGVVINTKKLLLGEQPANWSQYKNIILISTYGTAKQAIIELKESIPTDTAFHTLFLVLMGASIENTEELRSLMQNVDKQAAVTITAIDEEEKEYEVAQAIARQISMPEKAMPKDEFLEAVEKFLKNHNTCGLATGADQYIRCTPIEYEYENNAIYIITEGGNKFIGILKNPNVSVVVFEPYTTMAELNGLQIMGTAKLVEANSKEYLEAFHKKGIKPEALDKLPIDMNVLKISPKSYEFLSSSFRAKGYDAKQCYTVE